MKKFKILTLAIAVFALFVAAPAQATFQDMWAYVYRWSGAMNGDGTMVLTRATTGITFKVLAIDSDTAETLYVYADPAMTSLTNPVTTTNFAAATVCNDRVAFRVDPTDSTNDRYVDLIVVDTVGGYTAFVENFDKYQHSIVIDERPNIVHHGVIWFDATTTNETSTGVYFVADTMIHDVRVEVVTTSSADTINVGLLSSETSGDADGLRVNVLLTTAGFVADTAVITASDTIDYVPASTYGALLYTAITGTGTTVAANGGRSYLGHVVTSTNAKTITYTAGSTDPDGYIHYFFTRMR